MLVFSAITPHPPILIPAIGQDSLSKIKKTQYAMQELSNDFFVAKPETAIIISPHGNLMQQAFTINTAPQITANFKNFGDLETKLKFKNDIGLAYQIKETLETKIPIQMISDENLDHGASVPLFYLTKNLPDAKIIPFGYSGLNLNSHFKLGQNLAEIIHNSKKRIAIIASGDLSHTLTQTAPAGYNPNGKKFDKQLIALIQKRQAKKILNLDEKLILSAKECGFKSILILLGILSEHNYKPQILSYEGPFGVGYLVANFELNR